MQRLPFATKIIRYYFPLILHPIAFESFNFDDFDVVLSVSARYSHFCITKPSTVHVCYMNTPGRMFWEPEAYFKKEDYGFLRPLKKLAQQFLSMPLSYLRVLDYMASNRVDFFMSNSKTSHDRIKNYYGRNSEIVYPVVDASICVPISNPTKNYLVCVGRLVAWKRFDIAIEACNKLGLRLVIFGEGPDKQRLKSIAGSTIEFKEGVHDDEKICLMQNCTALINTQFEDFGIVPLEAMACGRPVIAFGKGGGLETVVENQTGVFFAQQGADVLAQILLNFDESKFEPFLCRKQALLFGKELLLNKLKSFVESKYSILN